MARGTESKAVVFDKLLEVFPDAFWEETGKILRVPLNEGGSPIEIKVTLTAAKNMLGSGAAAPTSAFELSSPKTTTSPKTSTPAPAAIPTPTQEEKDNVEKLLNSLSF